MKGSSYSVASFFAILCIVFIPFPFHLINVQPGITEFIFGRLIRFVSENVFGISLQDIHVRSDTTSLYVLFLLLFILALILGLLLSRLKKWERHRDKLLQFIYLLACYYLALQLMKYGLDKIFKNQFYLPEPNILYTPLGNVPRDLLYWSSMGTSHSYNIFLGSVEVAAALFILIRRTRLIGLLISFFVITNIVAVNFGFDISVKLFSLFLLFLTLYLLIPYIKALYHFFFSSEAATANQNRGNIPLFRNRLLSASLKWFAVLMIGLESFYPYISSGNFNDDRAKRPYMHGAYEVRQFISGADTLAPSEFLFKRFFIHRDSYMIFQDNEDEMVDYKLAYDTGRNGYLLIDYQMKQTPLQLVYHEADSLLVMRYFKNGWQQQVTGKALGWKKMPALRREFHWTAD